MPPSRHLSNSLLGAAAFAAALLFAVMATGAEPSTATDAEWSALKAAAAARPRIIINDDGCDATSYLKSTGEPTVENFYKFMLDLVKGTRITTVTYCPYNVGFAVTYPSQVPGNTYYPPCVNSALEDICETLIAQTGKDPMMLAQEFARANDLEFFGCMRMNDVHDMHFPDFMLPWKKAHPELLFGTAEKRPLHGEWTAYDFAHPEVRERLAAIIQEMMERYEVDGMELDFYRNLEFFKSVAWEQPVSQEERDGFTEMMRTIRREAERIGRSRGRPIVIACRLPESMELCRLIGLDVERWMQEGLFDLFLGGGDRGYYAAAAEINDTCRKYGLEYYGVLNDAYHFAGVFNRNTVASFDGLQAAAYAGGATGMYLFNCFYYPDAMKCATLDKEALLTREKSYFISHQHENNWGLLPDGYKRYNYLPELSPYRKLYGAVKKSYILQVGDEFTPENAAALKPRTHLYCDIHGNPDHVRLRLNGVLLREAGRNGTIVDYAIPLGILHPGANSVEIDTTAAAGSGAGSMTILGENVHAGRLGRPWQYIFKGHRQDKQPTMYADGEGARLVDRLRNANSMVNVVHCLAGIDGAPLALDFQLKVFPQTEAEGAVMRVADTRNVEVIDFQPEQIRLKFANLSVPFTTTDRYHAYQLDIRDGILNLSADGEPLFTDVKLEVPAGDMRAAFTNHGYLIPADAATASFLIGSFTGPGVGESSWRNILLKSDIIVSDLVLNVQFPPKVAPELQAAADSVGQWAFEADFSGGAIPEMADFTTTYKAPAPAPDGRPGVLIDNEIDGNIDGGFFLKNQELVAGDQRFLVAEWAITSIHASKASDAQPLFQMVLRPQSTPGKFYNFAFELGPQSILTPWGPQAVQLGKRLHFKAVLDREAGQGVLYMDGEPLAAGAVPEREEPPCLIMGDLSQGCGGAYLLEYLKVTRI